MGKKKLALCDEGPVRGRDPARQRATTLTRNEAARELGVSASTVRRLEGSELHPTTEPDGTHVFDREEVRALARARALASADPSPGELAARACELFREGRSTIDVIIALRQPFEVVREWQRSYIAESASLFVPEPTSTKMREAFFVEGEPFTAGGLYALLQRLTNRNLELNRRLRAISASLVQRAEVRMQEGLVGNDAGRGAQPPGEPSTPNPAPSLWPGTDDGAGVSRCRAVTAPVSPLSGRKA
jgi:hypothetical protein